MQPVSLNPAQGGAAVAGRAAPLRGPRLGSDAENVPLSIAYSWDEDLRHASRRGFRRRGMIGRTPPTADIDLPALNGRRDRIVPPGYAARLIAALPITERALWATAFYAGLRLGEMRALRARDIEDLTLN